MSYSEYVAKDMDEIRKALAAEQISYLGFSYGSTLGVWYATLFPQSVRAMVIDGAANPFGKAKTPQEQIDEQVEEFAAIEAQLEAALRACDDPTECPIHNDGDPIGYFMQAVSKLDMVSHAGNQSGREIAKGDGPRRCQFSPRCYSRTWWSEGSGNFAIDNALTRLYCLVSRGTKLDSILALAGGAG